MRTLFKKIAVISTLTFSSSLVFANDAQQIEVTQNNIKITSEELAAIYVLSEICPTLIENQDQFNQGLETLAQEYLPNSQQAVTTLNELAQQQSFKAVLDEARQDAKKAGNKVNKSICEEVSVYKNS